MRFEMELPDIVSADDSNFDYQVLAYSDHVPVLVFFWAQWELTCLNIDPILETLTSEYQGRFRLAKVDIDTNKELTRRYKIHTVPSLKVFYKGLISHQTEAVKTESQVTDFIRGVFPGPENLLVEKAIQLFDSGKFADVEEVCLEILEDYPDHPRAKLLLAKTLIWQAEYLEALTILTGFPPSADYPAAKRLLPLVEQLLNELFQSENTEGHLELVYRRAIDLFQSGNLEAALDGLLSIIRIDKNFRDRSPQQVILAILELLGEEHPITKEYRPLLANTLF
jgi:putative thioredoxin